MDTKLVEITVNINEFMVFPVNDLDCGALTHDFTPHSVKDLFIFCIFLSIVFFGLCFTCQGRPVTLCQTNLRLKYSTNGLFCLINADW